ncbi:MAG: NAD-dependent deacetylase [Ardenticatenales bacterium]|nr:NAD-dependent deacetylase [Ardenticatenales bacterium]
MADRLIEAELRRAVSAVQAADALLITAGAGMGVESGLPDFRSSPGAWQDYPALAHLKLQYEQLATPRWFAQDPALAWGFYWHKLQRYRRATPHAGFDLLRGWAEAKPHGYFVFTSNVDGHFQKAGFDPERVVECHGSLHHLQCTMRCTDSLWSAEELALVIDETTWRTLPPLPSCPICGGLARPNVLLFDDDGWVHDRSEAQAARLDRWLVQGQEDSARLVIIECGAGVIVPSVRRYSERLVAQGATLIRINPQDCQVPRQQIALRMGALEALQTMNLLVNQSNETN